MRLMLVNEREKTSYVVRNLGEKERCVEWIFFIKFSCVVSAP